ncbi:hypothetical protein VW41_22725 [Klebsiella michiganensis]|nr:hypothetical protein VW41_22725 [Klebsiella michiganensis]
MDYLKLYDLAEDESLLTFNPADINVKQENYSCDQILEMLKYDEINLNTDFQRSSDLWSDEKMSKFIESLMLKLPIPPFYFNIVYLNDNSDKIHWEVIDGLQRLSALRKFCFGDSQSKKLKLIDLDFFTELNGKYYEDIPRHLIRNFKASQLQLHLVYPNTPIEIKYRIFERINTTNLMLKDQEVRHALYQGEIIELLKKAVSEILIENNVNINDGRMDAQETVLRAISFTCFGHSRYPSKSNLKLFLDNAIKALSKLTKNELCGIYDSFYENFHFCIDVLGIDCFKNKTNGRSVFNKGLFDCLIYASSKLNDREKRKIRKSPKKAIKKYNNCFQDERFIKSISNATSRQDNVIYRLEQAEKIFIEEV